MEDIKQIALRALTGAFIDRDSTVVKRYFAPDYIQHNPAIPNGPAAIAAFIAGLSKDFSYEPVDIFRVANGKLAEHWDVLQEEVPASATASGNPMFHTP